MVKNNTKWPLAIIICRMAQEEKTETAAPAATEAAESTGSGFYNRRLHNYPLIKASHSAASSVHGVK